MSSIPLAERHFTKADQEVFAACCGDRNPIHMDAVAARRTMAGAPVVHGIHALLWGLDSLFRHAPKTSRVTSISATFAKIIYVGDCVGAVLLELDEQKARMQLLVKGVSVLRLTVNFGAEAPAEIADSGRRDDPAEPLASGSLLGEPLALQLGQLIERQGVVPFFSEPSAVSCLFPAAASVLGAERVAGLACSSFLVGMVCPGLHSLYGGLDLTLAGPRDHALRYHVADVDERFRRCRISIAGAGWTGSLIANVRPEPTAQADMAGLAAKLVPGEFGGGTALVIGGSRGLGELIAKIIAAGGGHVVLTYASGFGDALRVQEEITRFGGRCDIIAYDVRADPHQQLMRLPCDPDQLYYLATPFIFTQKYKNFEEGRLDEFIDYYVKGFHRLVDALQTKTGTKTSIFYPSSVAVAERPNGMTEYAMAKAAGELLCADMQAHGRRGPIVVSRLPRMATDQTATLRDVDSADPIEIMLPLVREVHAAKDAVRDRR